MRAEPLFCAGIVHTYSFSFENRRKENGSTEIKEICVFHLIFFCFCSIVYM